MKVEIVPFEKKYYHDVINLKLKEDDMKEVEASTGLPYRRVMQKTVNTHKESMMLILYKGTVSGIFGVVPSGKIGVGIGYLLTDDRLKEYEWDMAKYTIDVFLYLLDYWPIITNYVSAEHTVSIRWLKRNGARFDKKPVFLADMKTPFYKFELRKSDYV